MTLEWPVINHIDPKCVFVLSGMIFLRSGPNMKKNGLPVLQIYPVYRLCQGFTQSVAPDKMLEKI